MNPYDPITFIISVKVPKYGKFWIPSYDASRRPIDVLGVSLLCKIFISWDTYTYISMFYYDIFYSIKKTLIRNRRRAYV